MQANQKRKGENIDARTPYGQTTRGQFRVACTLYGQTACTLQKKKKKRVSRFLKSLFQSKIETNRCINWENQDNCFYITIIIFFFQYNNFTVFAGVFSITIFLLYFSEQNGFKKI